MIKRATRKPSHITFVIWDGSNKESVIKLTGWSESDYNEFINDGYLLIGDVIVKEPNGVISVLDIEQFYNNYNII